MYSPYDDLLGETDLYFGDNGLYSSSSSSSLSKVREVREAGERLHLLTRQVNDLEDIIRQQGAALSEKDAGHKVLRSQLKELKDIKERQIRELATAVKRLEEKNQQLDMQMKEKDDSLNECKKKLISLDRVVSHSIPSFEKLIDNLKRFTFMSDPIHSGRQDAIRREDVFASLAIDQMTLDECNPCDSGNPSSASDSYPVTGDDYDSIKRRLSSDVASVIRSSVLSRIAGAPHRDSDRASVISRVQRSLGYSGKQFERASESLASLPSDLVAVSSPKHSSRLSSVDVSPAYTPTAVRRRVHQASKLLLSSSSVTSGYNSDVSSHGYTDNKMNENSELAMLLLMAREESRTGSSKLNDDEPPEPAPPPTKNPGNNNLPCIQAPKRFLPSLNPRYE